jgi:hypothetical protein
MTLHLPSTHSECMLVEHVEVYVRRIAVKGLWSKQSTMSASAASVYVQCSTIPGFSGKSIATSITWTAHTSVAHRIVCQLQTEPHGMDPFLQHHVLPLQPFKDNCLTYHFIYKQTTASRQGGLANHRTDQFACVGGQLCGSKGLNHKASMMSAAREVRGQLSAQPHKPCFLAVPCCHS